MRSKLVFCCLVVVTASSGCRTSDVRDVLDMPLAPASGATLEDVEHAIQLGAQRSGWRATPMKAGVMLASRTKPPHVAVVLVRYDLRSFSIRYHNSQLLRYSGKEIHKTYNSWVRDLEEAIPVAVREGAGKAENPRADAH